MIPKEIRICGLNIPILLTDSIELDGRPVNGLFHPEEMEISLDIKDASEEKIAHVLMHEITHAISVYYLNDILTEDQIDHFSNGLYQTFSDNNLFNRKKFTISLRQRSLQ